MKLRLLEPWRSRLLWVSLGANLFAACAFAGPHVWPRPPPGPPGFDRLVERMARSLPTADAETFRTAMDRERPWYEMSRSRLAEARAEVGRRIGVQPFDPVATRAAMNSLQDGLRDSSTRFDESLVMALSAISAEGRARLSEEMVRRQAGPPERPR